MKQNEYESAEVVEIGNAETVILGGKILLAGIDSSGMDPYDRVYEE